MHSRRHNRRLNTIRKVVPSHQLKFGLLKLNSPVGLRHATAVQADLVTWPSSDVRIVAHESAPVALLLAMVSRTDRD